MLEHAIVELITSPEFPGNTAEIEEQLDRIYMQQMRESFLGTCIEGNRKFIPEDPEALETFLRLSAKEPA